MSVVLFVLSGCYVVMLCVKRNKKMLITKKLLCNDWYRTIGIH